MKNIWAKSDELFEEPKFDPDEGWQEIRHRIRTLPQPKKTILLRSFIPYGIAAALALVLIMVYRLQQPGMIRVIASDVSRIITLPDGSRVDLKQGSTMTYPEQFDRDKRLVSLSGTAFFHVAPDKSAPFRIDADPAFVRVVGTSFQVSTGSSGVEVVVSSGIVQLSDKKNGRRSLMLTRGKAGLLTGEQLLQQDVDTTAYQSWRFSALRFANRPLAQILEQLSKVTGKTIRFDASVPQELRRLKVTIQFRSQPLEEMLSELCLVTDCTWGKESNEYIIRSK